MFSPEKKRLLPIQRVATPAGLDTESEITNHGRSFGVVYANDLALAETKKERPTFPVGSILVREKNVLEDSPLPQTVIAMVKRDKGFSKDTNDWEFFLFDGYLMSLKGRETVGSCSKCHSAAARNDWVFLKEINKED